MAQQDDFMALEAGFWSGSADFYRQNLAERCLVAFTDMAGVVSREDLAATITSGSRWRDVDLDPKGMLELAGDVVVITYKARATRESGETYAALVSSCYVKSDGAWKLAFHQQTLIEPGSG